MTKKRKLSDLVREETQRPELSIEPTEPEPTEVKPTEPESDDRGQPKYLTLVRKETRLREDQLEQLTILTRKLNRQRQGGERITENTLIRVAIDLLLSRSDELSGTKEAELREALRSEKT
jgi:hypothetical protein